MSLTLNRLPCIDPCIQYHILVPCMRQSTLSIITPCDSHLDNPHLGCSQLSVSLTTALTTTFDLRLTVQDLPSRSGANKHLISGKAEGNLDRFRPDT